MAARTSASFNVRALDGQQRVICTGGRVECGRGGATMIVGPGEQVTYAADGAVQRSRTDVDVALAWRRGLLIFDGASLAEVITEINRYRPGRIILTDSTIGARPVNGVFDTAQAENTVAQIQHLLDVRLTRLPGDVVLIG